MSSNIFKYLVSKQDCLCVNGFTFVNVIFQEEQDIKALQAKNRKLGEALDQRQVCYFFLLANLAFYTHLILIILII